MNIEEARRAHSIIIHCFLFTFDKWHCMSKENQSLSNCITEQPWYTQASTIQFCSIKLQQCKTINFCHKLVVIHENSAVEQSNFQYYPTFSLTRYVYVNYFLWCSVGLWKIWRINSSNFSAHFSENLISCTTDGVYVLLMLVMQAMVICTGLQYVCMVCKSGVSNEFPHIFELPNKLNCGSASVVAADAVLFLWFNFVKIQINSHSPLKFPYKHFFNYANHHPPIQFWNLQFIWNDCTCYLTL